MCSNEETPQVRNPFKKPTFWLVFVGMISMSLTSLGFVHLFEGYLGMPLSKMPLELRGLVPTGGILLGFCLLFVLVPIYRVLAVEEWRKNWIREADAYWAQRRKETVESLEMWVSSQSWDLPTKSQALRALNNTRTEQPPRIH